MKNVLFESKGEYFTSTSEYKNLKTEKDGSGGTLAALSIVFTMLSIAAGVTGTLFYFKKKGKI